jgi:hypothetical protein
VCGEHVRGGWCKGRSLAIHSLRPLVEFFRIAAVAAKLWLSWSRGHRADVVRTSQDSRANARTLDKHAARGETLSMNGETV